MSSCVCHCSSCGSNKIHFDRMGNIKCDSCGAKYYIRPLIDLIEG